jgi:hypothetical protein
MDCVMMTSKAFSSLLILMASPVLCTITLAGSIDISTGVASWQVSNPSGGTESSYATNPLNGLNSGNSSELTTLPLVSAANLGANPNGAWNLALGDSQWIGPTSTSGEYPTGPGDPTGYYVYQLDLGALTGDAPGTYTISGTTIADSSTAYADNSLDGPVYVTTDAGTPFASVNSVTPINTNVSSTQSGNQQGYIYTFTIPPVSGTSFGKNAYLDFVVYNQDLAGYTGPNPSGFDLSANLTFAGLTSGTLVPLPSGVGCGLALMGLLGLWQLRIKHA